MAKKVAKVKYIGSAGQVVPQGEDIGYWDFLYQKSTIINPDFYPGDRVVLPDGRVFRYGLEHTSSAGPVTVIAGQGVKFVGEVANDGVASAVNRAQVVGDRELRFASQTFTKDELRGGYAVIYSAGNTYQQAGIIGNTACASTAMTVYLDRPLTTVVTSTQYCEICPNPYLYLGANTTAYSSVAGIPMSSPSAAQYFWIQTWGPLWVNPGPEGKGGSQYERRLVFYPDGSMRLGETANLNYQLAGFIIDMTKAGTDSPPFIMLQISP